MVSTGTLCKIDASDADFVAALQYERLPTSDLGKESQTFWRFERDGQTLGYCGIEAYGRDVLLRSLVVLPAHKGQGLGAQIVHATAAIAGERHISELWLLTNSAKDFFNHLSWQIRDRADAPEQIAASAEFTSLCPASATCMSLRLD